MKSYLDKYMRTRFFNLLDLSSVSAFHFLIIIVFTTYILLSILCLNYFLTPLSFLMLHFVDLPVQVIVMVMHMMLIMKETMVTVMVRRMLPMRMKQVTTTVTIPIRE